MSNEESHRVEDPLQWGYSLTNVREILLDCLDAIHAGSVLEIGAYEGELTADLLEWAAAKDDPVSVVALDPAPPQPLLALSRDRPELELLEETSHDVLGRIEALPDAIVIDGDHNYYTLREELRLIADKAAGAAIPLLFFHDVCWPHARRDTYYAPERIPEAERQPLGHNVGLAPGEPGIAELGLPFVWAAEREGGPGNGTLTAIEDFLSAEGSDRRLGFAVVPAFFGFGVMWDRDAPWADAVATLIAPFDRSPMLERLESNRVEHLVAGQARARELEALKARSARQETILRKLEGSSAFAVAERLSRLRHRGAPLFSRDEISRALEEDSGG